MKDLRWTGSTLKDLKNFPDEVIDTFGFELYQVQSGRMPVSAKPMKGGHLSGVYELREDHKGDTYRTVYIAKLESAVYVLHCFQKKSPSGIRTAKTDVDLIHERLKAAQTDYEARYGKKD